MENFNAPSPSLSCQLNNKQNTEEKHRPQAHSGTVYDGALPLERKRPAIKSTERQH